MPPLPADSIHARACKLKCEKILTRPASKETNRDRERNPLTETADRHEKPPLWYYPCGGIHKILFVFCKRDFHILSIDDCFLFALLTI